MYGWSVEDAAEVLDCPTGTVKSRCARGRARLRLLLRPAPDPVPRDSADEIGTAGNPLREHRVPPVSSTTTAATERGELA